MRRFYPTARALIALSSFVVLAPACETIRGDAMNRPLELWSYEPELRIGAIDDPDYAFTAISAMRIGPDGSIYTLHGQEATIRRWTPDGLPAGSFGRRGEGPGEFQRPITMGMRGDTLWVMDLNGYRFSFFSLDGSPIGTLSPRIDLGSRESNEKGIYPARPTSLLADGFVLGATATPADAVVDGTLTSIAHVRMSPEGSELDTIAVVPIGRSSTLGISLDRGGIYTSQPFGDDVITTTTVHGDGFLVLDRTAVSNPTGAEFRLTRLGLAGDTVFSRAYAYEPVELPRAEVDSAIAATAERLHGMMGERTGTRLGQWQGWVREAMHAPAFRTPVRGLVAGRDDSIWLGLNPVDDEVQEWLVLDSEGEPLARVQLPSGLRVLQVDRTAIWGVEKDELDVEYIVKYRAAVDV